MNQTQTTPDYIKPADSLHAERESIAASGFFIFNTFLDSETTTQLIRAVESLPPDEQSSRTRRQSSFARRNLLSQPFVHSVIHSRLTTDLINALAPGCIPVRAILFDKTGDANWTVPWHQDRSIAVRERLNAPNFGPWSTKAGITHVQPPVEILKQMFTLRFHLDPCDTTNGPLRVIPATHHHILDQTEIDQILRTTPQTTCTCQPGGLLIMKPLILHASSPAAHLSHRRVIHVEFGPPSLPHNLQWAKDTPTQK
jgi:hypothetical protein